jgi:hypothetical protein
VRKDSTERHKEWTDPALQGVVYLGVRKNVDPGKKVAATVVALEADAKAFLSNLSVERGTEAAATPHDYAELERAVSGWTLKEWEAFRGNVQIKLKNKQPISQLELDCSSVWSQLGTWVAHRAEVSDDVYFIGSERLERLCPGSFEDHVTEYGKRLQTYRWSNRLNDVVLSTVQDWLDGDEHEKCSLLLLGDSEVGKSKMSMLIAQEPSGMSALAR